MEDPYICVNIIQLGAMRVSRRKLLWGLLIVGLSMSFWQYFEFAYTLYENRLIASPLWSGTLGWPVPHHGYIGYLVAGACIAALEAMKSERSKDGDAG